MSADKVLDESIEAYRKTAGLPPSMILNLPGGVKTIHYTLMLMNEQQSIVERDLPTDAPIGVILRDPETGLDAKVLRKEVLQQS